MKANNSGSWDKIFSDSTALIIFIVSIVYVIAIASIGWNGMLSQLYAFRQTQTAITVSYLLKGGPLLAYETPVLGPPWSIPFEFPFYQWLVALVVKTGLVELDQAGRFVSEAFFIAALYPLFNILGFLKLSRRQRYLILAIFCISPQYLFWSRTFMIESTALSLSLYFLWLVFLCCEQFAVNRLNRFTVAGVAVFGALAGLVKVTTFFAFLFAACLVIATGAYSIFRKQGYSKKDIFPLCMMVFFAIIIPFLAVLAWTSYADSLKSLNPMASWLTSDGLKVWNFGTFEQKISLKTWQVFYYRTLTDLIGKSWLAVLTILMAVFCRKESVVIAVSSLGLFLLTLLTFTNLQYVHSYYSYANGIFLIVAVGVIISDFLESRKLSKRLAGISLFCLVVFFCIQSYFSGLWQFQNERFDFSPITVDVDAHSNVNDVFIVFGNDWSSEIPYHINRRAVMVKKGDLNDPALIALKKNMNGYRIGGLIFYTRGGFNEGVNDFTSNAARFFNIFPGIYSIFPWYKINSEILIVYNSGR